jgi:hypothetical protein
MAIGFDDVFVIVDAKTVRHFEGREIEVHLYLSDGNAFEGLYGGLEGLDGDANLFLPVLVPIFLQQLCVLACSFLNLQIRVSLETSNHLLYSFLISKFLVKFQQTRQPIGDSIVTDTHFKYNTLDEIQYISLVDADSFNPEHNIRKFSNQK